MKATLSEPLTAEDYRQLPPGGPQYQLIEGELYMAPAPNRYHQEIVGNLFEILRNHIRKHRIGRVYVAPFDVYLDDINVLQPDLCFVSKANSRILTDDGAHGAPDLAIEIISPTNAQLDKKPKRKVYARAGVRELWLIDPILLQIHIYDLARNPDKPVKIIEDDESFESNLLPGLTILAAEVFRK